MNVMTLARIWTRLKDFFFQVTNCYTIYVPDSVMGFIILAAVKLSTEYCSKLMNQILWNACTLFKVVLTDYKAWKKKWWRWLSF